MKIRNLSTCHELMMRNLSHQGYQPPINNETFPYICYVLLPLQFYRLVSDRMTMVAQDLFGFRVCVLVNDTIFIYAVDLDALKQKMHVHNDLYQD